MASSYPGALNPNGPQALGLPAREENEASLKTISSRYESRPAPNATDWSSATKAQSWEWTMLQLDRNTKQIGDRQLDAHSVNASDPDFRHEPQAMVIAEQRKVLGLAFNSAWRLIRHVVWVVIDFWNIPVLAPSDTPRS
jgi:hypothetical protein